MPKVTWALSPLSVLSAFTRNMQLPSSIMGRQGRCRATVHFQRARFSNHFQDNRTSTQETRPTAITRHGEADLRSSSPWDQCVNLNANCLPLINLLLKSGYALGTIKLSASVQTKSSNHHPFALHTRSTETTEKTLRFYCLSPCLCVSVVKDLDLGCHYLS